MEKVYKILSLGDSYTIGEGVLLQKSFPYQLVQQLRKKGFAFSAPEIIAKTGWTTEQLSAAIEDHHFLSHYHFVTLLIGVNDQYGGASVEEYKVGFENLLKKVLHIAEEKKEHVLVLSIPDYSSTPFGQAHDPEKTAKEIDLFNSVTKALSIQYKVNYIDITSLSREAQKQSGRVAEDGLHPSEEEYSLWVAELIKNISPRIK